MHFYAWKRGLKTGMYYLRTLPAAYASQLRTVHASPEDGDDVHTCGPCDTEATLCLSCSA